MVIPRVLLERSVPAGFIWLEVASTITMAAIFWTSFGTFVAIIISVVIVTWVQRLVFA